MNTIGYMMCDVSCMILCSLHESVSLRGVGLMSEDAMCYATHYPTPTYYMVMGGAGGVN